MFLLNISVVKDDKLSPTLAESTFVQHSTKLLLFIKIFPQWLSKNIYFMLFKVLLQQKERWMTAINASEHTI